MASAGAKASGRFFKSEQTRQVFKYLAWVPVGIFFVRHGYSLATVTGASMQPTFNPTIQAEPLHNDVVLLERWSVAIGRFRRGDVVTLWSPSEPNTLTTKRIIGLEGDIIHPIKPSTHSVIRVPQGQCWVEGDSHRSSRDSNTYGPIPLGLINARVAYVIWPWSRRGLVDSTQGKAGDRVQRKKLFNDLGGIDH